MTYCVGIEVDEGLVFAADTRTSASFDDVRVHGKLHVFEFPGERVLVLMTAGNLATSQAVLARLRRDVEEDAATSLRTVARMTDAAEYVGQVLVGVQAQLAAQAEHGRVNLESTLILGGQIAGGAKALYLIYPVGNCIAASPETPYLQIGESKYGKPILDRIVRPAMHLEDAARCALVSLDSTIRSNLSVGLPIDLVLLRVDALRLMAQMRLDGDTPLYAEIRDSWSRKLERAVHGLPRFAWEPPLAEDAAAAAATAQVPALPAAAPLQQAAAPVEVATAQAQSQQAVPPV
ncbi:MAG TPA: 20S proteasome subunit A/B [Dokdonella sp.]|uniref:20S proteasome subunit A/B n=1 Tax=Dokdonella sp. TaxID=2291710 RepID=UPI002B71D5A3|nr:20S proteasome subunit A/B [Dokdonella sp.]HUD43647.1 20S proteasome subunit A/B [Dokdonella sp.]